MSIKNKLLRLEKKAGINTDRPGILQAPQPPESVEAWAAEVQEYNRKMKQTEEECIRNYHSNKLSSCANLKAD